MRRCKTKHRHNPLPPPIKLDPMRTMDDWEDQARWLAKRASFNLDASRRIGRVMGALAELVVRVAANHGLPIEDDRVWMALQALSRWVMQEPEASSTEWANALDEANTDAFDAKNAIQDEFVKSTTHNAKHTSAYVVKFTAVYLAEQATRIAFDMVKWIERGKDHAGWVADDLIYMAKEAQEAIARLEGHQAARQMVLLAIQHAAEGAS